MTLSHKSCGSVGSDLGTKMEIGESGNRRVLEVSLVGVDNYQSGVTDRQPDSSSRTW